MNKRIYVLILLSLFIINTNGQNIFLKLFSSTGIRTVPGCINTTSDSGYIITGNEAMNTSDWSPFLIRLDSLGDTLWTKFYHLTGQNASYYTQQTKDGGFIMTGRVGQVNYQGFYLAKTDSLGNLSWVKNYLQGASMPQYPYYCQQTNDGGYVIGGVNEKNSFIKLDSAGSIVWDNLLLDTNFTFETIKAGVQTNDGGFIFTGKTYYQVTNSDLLLIKADSSGDTVWTKTYGSSGYDIGSSIVQTADSGYIITGTYNDQYILVLKVDANGDTLWSRSYKDSLRNCFGNTIIQTQDGGYLIFAFGGPDYRVYLIKIDSTGSMLWSKDFLSGYNFSLLLNLQQTADGGYVFVGRDTSNTLTFLIKTDGLGNSICYPSFLPTIGSYGTILQQGHPVLTNFPWNLTPTTIAFQPGNDGFTLTECSTATTEEYTNPSYRIIIFPNPAQQYLSIKSDQPPSSVIISSIIGETITSFNTKSFAVSKEILIDISLLAEGFYYVTINTTQGVTTKKIIKN